MRMCSRPLEHKPPCGCRKSKWWMGAPQSWAEEEVIWVGAAGWVDALVDGMAAGMEEASRDMAECWAGAKEHI